MRFPSVPPPSRQGVQQTSISNKAAGQHTPPPIFGDKKAASLLRETLDEEKETDLKLTGLAEKINVKAAAAAAR